MRPTIRDVAKKVNLSITTVSRALDGYDDVAEATREQVIKTAREMGYSPNRAARQLRRQKAETIGFILPAAAERFAEAFFTEFIAGLGHESALHTTPPQFLVLPAITPLPVENATRPLALIEMMSEFHDGPAEAMLGTVDADGMPMHQMWMDPVSENPDVGDTETWEFYNFTADAHPMHVHEVAFEVVNRQALVTNKDGETEPPARLAGDPRPPEAWESGFKDTVIAYPGEVTRIKAKFETAGTFVWHCHIVEHEDNEMMRPYRIGPKQPGQPE